jgi:hypothetical protein
MNKKLKDALLRMGYRKMDDDGHIWGKPVAYHLFAVRIVGKVATFFNYFKGMKKIELWESKKIVLNGDSYEAAIKFIEYGTRTNISARLDSDFGFITAEQTFEDVL